ncbi:carbohydrate ABC transporter permease [Phyllobacterium zundukense]|uniref:ABC transporter permease n=1 Tax=Phyllobacterium zundukense TaxID=1867719 RepID=A0A2N9VQY8_9HYPH|nr:sugar ABC transporter permease [Phyllobacterium zundukense]ATU92341.1 ABC transporter permease [Phyllobacterium zundukense]PIO41906.1 ABC transporter permease [Phyllobacterium zundukense]
MVGGSSNIGWKLFLTPLVGFLLLFLGFPVIIDLVYSISKVNFESLRNPVPNGFENYGEVLGDRQFWRASWFSLRFGIITALAQCLLGLCLAVFLSPLIEKRAWLMAPLMLPLMVAPAMVGLMYRLVLHEFVGPVPYYLYMWFGDSPAFLNADNSFWTLVVVETLQWTPFAFLLFYTAYQAISPEIRKAASMDGASAFQILRFIELPLMRPTLLVGFFIRFIDGFRVFDNVYTLTGSGPGGSTASLPIYIYETFFKQGAIGKAIAASIILFLVSFAVLYGLNWLGSREKAVAR